MIPGVNAPPPEARVVEGDDGWLLAVPASPVTPGDEVKIWFNGSQLERGGPRVYIAVQVELPDGQFGANWGTNIGAPGWTFLPLRMTEQIGSYTATIRDLETETRESLVQAEFTVGEE